MRWKIEEDNWNELHKYLDGEEFEVLFNSFTKDGDLKYEGNIFGEVNTALL